MSAKPSTLSPVKQALLALEEMTAKVDALERAQNEPIAIIGLGCRFPGSPNPDAFWQILRDGRDVIGEIPESRWNSRELYHPDPEMPGKMNTRWGGFVDGIDQFDPAFFGISPREAASMDPQQRLLLEVAWEAFENAGQGPEQLAAGRTGVFVGLTGVEYSQLFRQIGGQSKLDVYYASGISRSVAGGRISYVLGIEGPNLAIDTACSSSLVAVHAACLHLRSGDCRIALAGGANVILSPEITMAFSKAHMMASDGRCKAFDAAADGFVRAEGCGLVVLKPLSEALAGGDRVLAVIRGSAVNQDGRSSGLTAPSGPAQEAVIREALKKANVQGCDIDYVETHGTGTSLGDPIEAHALRDVLGVNRGAVNPLVIGSVKSNMGHLEAAAGVAGLIKAVLALQNEWIPAHLNFHTLNPHIDWRGVPVEVPVNGRPWQRGSRRRLAGVSAFGFSGTNAHVILEDAPVSGAVPGENSNTPYVLTLSARTGAALKVLAGDYAAHLSSRPELRCADVCHTANTGRTPLPERMAVVGVSTAELAAQLAAATRDGARPGVVRGAVERARNKVVFLFSGQGTQYAGMARELYEAEPVFRSAIDECEQLLTGEVDLPLASLLWGSASDRLGHTRYTQPCLFSLEWALAQLWRSWGVEPAIVLGHSVGEYAAACVAGVYTLAEGIRLIAARGRLIGGLPAGEGAMAAILAPVKAVQATLTEGVGEVEIAAVNGAENVVISGAKTAVETITARFEREGYRTERLHVSHAFHSPLMAPIEKLFEAEAARLSKGEPKRTLISSVTGKAVSAGELQDAGYWRRQVRQAVQFRKALDSTVELGGATWVEVGPGTTLLGLTRAVVEGACLLPSLRKGKDEPRLMAESLAALWTRGVPVNWKARSHREACRVALPTYPFERQRYWIEASGGNAGESPALQPNTHPLLGTPVQTARGEVVCEARIGSQTGLLSEHVVHGVAVLPATGYIEMLAGAASKALGVDAVVLERVAIDQALTVRGPGELEVQTLVTSPVGGSVTVEIYSRAPTGGPWVRHASASSSAAPAIGAAEGPAVGDLQKRCAEVVDLDRFQQNLHARGLAFGPSFLGLREIRRGKQEAVGRIEPPSSAERDTRFLGMHPAVLDACIQTLAAAAPGFDAGDSGVDVYMPVAIDRILWNKASAGATYTSFAWYDSAERGADLWTGNVRVSDGQREVVLIEGLRLKRAPKERVQGNKASPDVLYEIRWQEAPRPEPQPLELTCDSRSMRERLKELCRACATDEYDRLSPALDRMCTRLVIQALESLGWSPVCGDSVTSSSLGANLGIQARYVHLLDRFLEILSEDGFLTRVDDRWELTRSFADRPADGDDISAALNAGRPDVMITMRCGARLGLILRGEAGPLDVLFSNGQLGEAAALYTSTPLSRAFNSTIGELLAVLASRIPAGHPVRVLEIGAGTGGTTTSVLPYLPADRAEYQFTDLGRSFVERAKQVFADSGRRMKYQILDIERDPAEQGVACGAFDIVIASNVLHATGDLVTSLRHARKLLRPGGALVVFECIRPQRWFDLTFGLTEGWWRFAGRDSRRKYTLLDEKGWDEAMAEAGFGNRSAILRDDLAQPAYAILTGVAGQVSAEDLCVIFDDETELTSQLAGKLRDSGRRCLRVRRGESYTTSDEGVTIRPENAADYVRMLHDAQSAAGTRVREIVHLWAVNRSGSDYGGDLLAAQLPGCRSVLYLVQALISRGGLDTACWIATSNTQPAGPGDRVQIPHSTVWGLVRAIGAERPQSRFACLDLGEPCTPHDAANLIFQEMAGGGGERQVAYRSNRRFVARFERRKSHMVSSEPAELWLAPGRGLEDLAVRPQVRRAPAAGQVEIEVHSAGLNFRDVLNAMQMRTDAEGLGGEASGVVTAVGAGVTAIRPGDAVIAVAPATFASFVLAPQELVVPKPGGMTFPDAATVPFAFLTADYCLREIGRLKPGERILIHAAAGGVGLAAVQIATAIGAEVSATAGSPEKREYLRSLGVNHVMDSRSLAFADEVLRRTGGEGVDVVLNSMSGPTISAGLRILRPGGRFLEIGKAEIWDAGQVAAVNAHARYFAIDLTPRIQGSPQGIRERLLALLAEMDAGKLRPLPRASFPLRDAAAAFRHMARAKHIGKVLVMPPCARREARPLRFRNDGWYLLTGGLRGLGVEVAGWMARRGARKLALCSRRPPSPEVECVLDQLRAQGVELRTMAADVSRKEDVQSVLAQLAGAPLRGVIHMAGVLDDGLLQDQTWERFEAVLAPKVLGAWHLHTLTRSMPLEVFALFSSVASVLGSAGQANHAAANAFLDGLAHLRRADGLPAVSINWGPWAGAGAAAGPAVQRRLAGMGLQPFSIDQGLKAFEEAVVNGSSQVTAVTADWRTYLGQMGTTPGFFRGLVSEPVIQHPAGLSAPVPGESLRDRVAKLPEGKRRGAVEAGVEACARRVLGLRPGQAFDFGWPLTDMGMDSLMAVELRNAIASQVGEALPATLLFDYPTITALGGFLTATLFGVGPKQSESTQAVTPDMMLSGIEQLSDEEVDRLLQCRESITP